MAIALIAASFVAALPAATAAPFLSSSANATLHTQIGLTCPASVGDVINYDMGLYGADDYANPSPVYPPPSPAAALKADEAREAKIAKVAASAGGLSAPQTVWHATNSKVQIGQQSVAVTSMTLPDFADHVHPVAGPSGSGVWIPDGFANAYHVKVGDPFVYTSLWGPPTKLRVAAIYTDLRGDPNNPAFCSMHDLIFGPRGAQLANSAVAPIVLMDRATFLTGVVPYHAKATINFALADAKMPADQTSHVIATIKTVNRTFPTLMGPCQGCQSSASQLTAFATRSQLARSGIKPTVLPITAAGVLVGLVVVGAAAVFWVLRRRRELTVLSAHGMGSASLGVKAVLEALPAARDRGRARLGRRLVAGAHGRTRPADRSQRDHGLAPGHCRRARRRDRCRRRRGGPACPYAHRRASDPARLPPRPMALGAADHRWRSLGRDQLRLGHGHPGHPGR